MPVSVPVPAARKPGSGSENAERFFVHANSDLGIAVLFGVDVLACPRCGQARRLIALIDPTDVVQRILHHLGLPTEVPEPAPARAPPSLLETDAIDGCAAELAFDPPC